MSLPHYRGTKSNTPFRGKEKAPHLEGLLSYSIAPNASQTARARIRLLSGSPFGWNRRGGYEIVTDLSAWIVTMLLSSRRQSSSPRFPTSCTAFRICSIILPVSVPAMLTLKNTAIPPCAMRYPFGLDADIPPVTRQNTLRSVPFPREVQDYLSP